MSVDETMPNAIAGRTDLPKDLAHKIAKEAFLKAQMISMQFTVIVLSGFCRRVLR